MPDYAGEKYRIETRNEKDFDGSTLIPEQIDHVQVQIYNRDLSELLIDETMPYDHAVSHWAYEFRSTKPEAGSLKYFITFWDLDGTYSTEGPFRLRLKTDPRPG